MDFRTRINLIEENPIHHQHSILLIGSCFSDSIGVRLQKSGFNTLINPFGVLYNPLSISRNLKKALSNESYFAEEIRQNKRQYFHFDHHTRFSSESAEQVLENIRVNLDETRRFIQNLDILIITPGTSWIYEWKETGEPVANCHKLPESYFTRRILSISEIVEDFGAIYIQLKEIRPELRIIFTLSPVRHWKYGAHGNQLSKARLLLAMEEICAIHPGCSYFPSYEIMLDELRDYRFYAEDMLHPSNQAADYIFECFGQVFFNETTRKYVRQAQGINQAANHQVFYKGSKSHLDFIQQQLRKIQELKMDCEEINLNEAEKYFEDQLEEVRKLI